MTVDKENIYRQSWTPSIWAIFALINAMLSVLVLFMPASMWGCSWLFVNSSTLYWYLYVGVSECLVNLCTQSGKYQSITPHQEPLSTSPLWCKAVHFHLKLNQSSQTWKCAEGLELKLICMSQSVCTHRQKYWAFQFMFQGECTDVAVQLCHIICSSPPPQRSFE